ncbi:MAG TPA: hypothetical protein DCK98_06845 [Chloroflexi bacterium]|nr:hypothetical protein [Chloroflexota bacterium]HAL25723.1 hypothetical protein [Chloroflexota bacterium]
MLGFGLLLVVVASLAATVPTVAAPAPPTTYANTTYGFELTLPDGWHRSDVLSNTKGLGDSRLLEWDVFTARTPASEKAGAVLSEVGLPPAWQWTVEVEVWNNPKGLSALAWASDPNLAGWARGQTIKTVTVNNQAAAQQVGGALHAVSYYVAAKGYMFRFGFYQGTPEERPTLATDAGINGILASFRVK